MKNAKFSQLRLVGFQIVALSSFVLLLAGNAPAAQFTLRVDGMACPFCAYGIEKKLLATPGIDDLKILMDEGKIILTLAHRAQFDVIALHSAIENAGFTLHSILVDNADGQLSRNEQGDLEFTVSDPVVTFALILKEPAVLDLDAQEWPIQVLVTGAVTEYTDRKPELIASEIVSHAKQPVP